MRITIDPSPKPDYDIDELIAEMKKLLPPPEEQALIDANRAAYWKAKKELSECCPNKWIAFYEGMLFAACDTPEEVYRAVDEARIPRSHVVFEHFPYPRPRYFL